MKTEENRGEEDVGQTERKRQRGGQKKIRHEEFQDGKKMKKGMKKGRGRREEQW